MTGGSHPLALPRLYRLWQAPFQRQKLAPILATGDVARARRVLDVACGPGLDAPRFAHADYTGLDANAAYVEHARMRHPGARFLVADALGELLPDEPPFDFVLANSFLHHVDDAGARRVLGHLARLVTEDGHVHVLDLVLPESPCIARALARADRGDHPRTLDAWRTLFTERFEPVLFEPYAVRLLGLPLWHMIYFKGKARRES
jgi:SAM-dependent methyltransferase